MLSSGSTSSNPNSLSDRHLRDSFSDNALIGKVELDVRTLYLKDLALIGCTFQDRKVFENLIGYIERNEITPLVSKTYPLKDIIAAQKDFVSKKYVGKLVLLP